MAILRVALPVRVDQLFDYLYVGDAPLPMIGARVRVPLGRRTLVGVVVGHSEDSDVPKARLKPIEAVIDRDSALFSDEILGLCHRVARYYHHPLGEVLATAMPGWLRQGRVAELAPSWEWRLTSEGAAIDPAGLTRAIRQRQVLEHLEGGAGPEDELLGLQGVDRSVLAALENKGWILRAPAAESSEAGRRQPGPRLTDDQRLAVEAVGEQLGVFHPWLLHGITGSGKTEVYLDLVGRVLDAGQQGLVIVPEIGLTPQLMRRFRRRLGDRVGVLHSALADGERATLWLRAREGALDVVLGTRSAVFAPLPNLGLIVVDEEHDASLKQQDGLRYSARDLAVLRAQALDRPVLLGSATPSLEALHNVRVGRYTELRLSRRATGASPPRLQCIDLRGQPPDQGLTPALRRATRDHLDRGGQVLLFLNRRGFSPVLICHACGWTAECPRCDARMTLHRSERSLRCHHCDRMQPMPTICPSCDSSGLEPLGHGTQRLEDEVEAAFDDVPVMRLDRDATRRRDAWPKVLAQLASGEPCILLGTQMLAKGHDYPNITLVGVINLDQALFSSDFRAAERAAQLLVQVAGRAGRAERPGTVLVQTHHPEHPLFTELLDRGYPAFAERLLAEREAAGYPPCTHMALLRAEAVRSQAVQAFIEEAARQAGRPKGVQVLGPLPAPMERRAGRQRMQLILLASARADLHRLLDRWMPALYGLREAARVRWSLDVDPADTF